MRCWVESVWDEVIENTEDLLRRVENRAARLKGAVKTFTELRDHGHPFSGPESVEQI